ncbi:MAG: IS200/IS605 family element transposase accessory protein TnpB [Burkholderiaceae bacterium]
MRDRPVFTYQTRIAMAGEATCALEAYASLHGRVERSLFAEWSAGHQIGKLKPAFQARFGITARQFNAIRVGLEGKISSIKERRPDLIAEGGSRVSKAEKVIRRLEKDAPGSNKLHQKRRRLQTLRHRLEALKSAHERGVVHLCFGSRKLCRAQFDLQANGYASHEAWKADWESERCRQFFVLGSQDETAGNQTCQAIVAADGSLTLHLRLPDSLARDGKHLVIPEVRFAYGHNALVAALASSRKVESRTQDGKAITKRIGTAISYRFLRDEKGWRVFASVEAQRVEQVSHRMLGAFGVDVNADHLAVAETDHYGNLIGTHRIALPLVGKTADQAKALIGDAAVLIAGLAKAAGKPVVIEQLNFQKKKAELEAVDSRQAKRISSFACGKVASSMKAACFRAGVEAIEINPAYTSVIGAVEHAQKRGISVHMGAAFAIARRGLGLSERLTKRKVSTPVRNGGHVTFDLPVRNRSKHVWSFWSDVRTRLKAAHKEHYRSGAHRDAPPPLRPAKPALGAPGSITAQSRDANRLPYCSGDVLEDAPY